MPGRFVFALLALLASCGVPSDNQLKTPLPEKTLLRWSVSHFGESTDMSVQEDGSVLVVKRLESGRAGPGQRYQTALRQAELDELLKLLESTRVCHRRSSRETGVPDEARPLLRVSWRELQCSVQMWDGEWRDDSGGVGARLDGLAVAATQ